jgi:hypothetical protein
VTTTALTQPRAARSRALVVVVVFATALGVMRLVALRAPAPDSSSIRVGGVSYRVAGAEQVKGLTDADLSGMAHGIQGLVTADKALVTVSVVISAGDSPASFDPSQLEVVAGSGTPIPAIGATLSGGPLDAHASLEGAISFVVPRDGSRLALVAPGQSHGVDLLQVDVAAPGSGSHAHEAASTATSPAGSAAAQR